MLAATDPAGAQAHAQRARAVASGPYVTEAVLAAGWAQLGGEDLAAAGHAAAEARAALAAAENRYHGDFLENEPYEDWSVATREEARAAHQRTVRTLAELSRGAGQVDDAVHYLLKLIDKDPYDEAGHRELVAVLAGAGRHGESRRAHARYVSAMRDIGIEPALDPSPR